MCVRARVHSGVCEREREWVSGWVSGWVRVEEGRAAEGWQKGRRAGAVGTRFSTRPSICIVPLAPVENTCIDVSGASTPKSYSRGHSFG